MYRQILKNSLLIAWRAKPLWFFGLFAYLAFFKDGPRLWWRAYSQLHFSVARYGVWHELRQSGLFDLFQPANLFDALTTHPGRFIIFIFVSLLLLAVFAFIVWLVFTSQGALIRAVWRLVEGRDSDFWSNFKEAKKKFWQVLTLNLLLKIFVFFSLFAFFGMFSTDFLSGHFAAKQIFVLLAVFILAFFTIFASLAIRYALITLAAERTGFIGSLKNGVQILRRNFLASLEMILLAFAARLIFWLVLLVGLFFIITPFALMIAGSFIVHSFWLFRFALYLGTASAAVSLIFLVIFYTVFEWSVWTMFYGELRNEQAKSKLVRAISRLVR